jgi:hypothetical protein
MKYKGGINYEKQNHFDVLVALCYWNIYCRRKSCGTFSCISQGKIVIPPQYDGAWDFSKGLARVVIDEKKGYIDKTGKYVWEPTESPYQSK